MTDELVNLLREKPHVITKRLLTDVFKKEKLLPWTSLNVVQSRMDSNASDYSADQHLRDILSELLEKLRLVKPYHARILERIYWEQLQTVEVARIFSEEKQYALDSGTFYKWYKNARHEFGTILIQHENQSFITDKNSIKSEDSASSDFTKISTLSPLEPEQRQRIQNAKSVSILGVTLFRTLPVFQYEFCDMLARGGHLRILLVDHHDSAIEMASLRSDTGTPIETQKRRVSDMLELLSRWKSNIVNADIEVRLLKYFPPYGITIINPGINNEDAFCLVRLMTFRTSTSTAPSIQPDPNTEINWFSFFCEQFEKMWDFSEPFEFL